MRYRAQSWWNNWIPHFHCPFILSWHSFCNWENHRKVTVATLICWFSPIQWDCKGHRFSFLVKPLVKIRCTCATKILCSPTFALMSNFATKVMVVCLFNHCSYLALLRCKHHFTTNVANYVEVIYKNTNKLQRKVLNRRRLKLNLVGHFQLLKLLAFDHISSFSNNLEMIHQNHTLNSS